MAKDIEKEGKIMDGLKKRSLNVRAGMMVYWPNRGECRPIDPTKSIKEAMGERVYNSRNGIISYVYEGKMYVTPCDRDAMAVLAENGFRHKEYMYVPLSYGEYPQGNSLKKWKNIVEEVLGG